MSDNFPNLRNLLQDLSELKTKRKEDYNRYLANKLNDPLSSPETFWKIFEISYDGNKIPLIPPIRANDKLVSDYEEKANHFNKFFASQCTPIDNNSQIPDSVVFSKRRSFLLLLVKTMIFLKLSEILTLARTMVLMIYQSEWSSYVMIPLFNNLSLYYSRTVLILVSFPIAGKNQTFSQSTSKMRKS